MSDDPCHDDSPKPRIRRHYHQAANPENEKLRLEEALRQRKADNAAWHYRRKIAFISLYSGIAFTVAIIALVVAREDWANRLDHFSAFIGTVVVTLFSLTAGYMGLATVTNWKMPSFKQPRNSATPTTAKSVAAAPGTAE